MSKPELTSRHRDTVDEIFRHPTSHNIEWRHVLSLLEHVGEVSEEHNGKVKVTLGPETETFHRPRDKDVDVQMVVDLRRICLLYTSPSPRDRQKSRMPSSA